ncbi:MAG: MASE3 domain-containing protein [Syntrophorhabdaceae bacterium]
MRILSQYKIALLGILALPAIYFISRYNYNLFHSLADGVSIIIAASSFMIIWNSRRSVDNNYLLYVGISFFFFAFLDLMHVLGNKNMGVFPEYGNLGPTFYIAGRYILGVSLMIAPLFITRKLNTTLMFAAYSLITSLILLSIFYWQIFPATIVEGVGLTPFKVISDFLICLILLGAIGLLFIKRQAFDAKVLWTIISSIVLLIATGLTFTLYTDPFGITNMLGHVFQVAAFYLIYLAFIETGVTRPQDILFRKLKQSETNLALNVQQLDHANNELIQKIAERKRMQKEYQIAAEFLRILNNNSTKQGLLQDVVSFLKDMSGCKAIGIRLKEGDDYPYYETHGFPKEFIDRESQLCLHDAAGQVIRDDTGNPVLECMCGNVIQGRFDVSKPFFSKNGSFWTNSTTEAGQSCTRNRCNSEGYESVALIPLRTGQKTYGIIQLNDPEKGRFSLRFINFWETLAGYLSVALGKIDSDEALKKAHDRLEQRVKERTSELERSRERFRTLAELLPETVFEMHKDGRITYVNARGLQMFGYSVEDLHRGIEFRELIAESDYDRAVKNIHGIIRGEPREGNEYTAIRKDGGHFPVFLHSSRIEQEGTIMGLRGIIVDMTESRIAETERKRLEEELHQAHKMEAIGTLAGGIAHDFNNMLAVIIGNAELAMDDLPQGDALRYNVEAIFKAGKRGRDLVRQILTFSRKNEPQQKNQHIIPLIQESFQLLRASIPSIIEIKLDIKTKSDTVKVNEAQFQQILVNLCTNATHAMKDRGGLLVVSLEDETLLPNDSSDREVRDYLRLTVSDSGTGMEQDLIRKIFDPYFTTKKIGEGTGMGLSVVHGIVKAHNGFITVHSEPGKGSSFDVLLPKPKDPAPIVQTSEVEPVMGGEGRILFVDDESDVMLMATAMLTKLGYNVASFADSQAALDAFTRDPFNYDLIITDQSMPRLTGVMLTKRVKAIRPDVPVLLCTGYSETVSAEEAKAQGIEGYIMKPFMKNDMATAIRNVLDRGRSPDKTNP